MDKALKVLLFLLFNFSAYGQGFIPQIFAPQPSTSAPITLDASCTGNPSSVNPASCSSSVTPTAGDCITVKAYINGTSFDPGNIVCSDSVNGIYDGVRGATHPQGSNDWVVYYVKCGVAATTVTPQCFNWEPNGWGISARIWKNTRTSFALDGGSVNQFTNHTTGSVAPTSSASTSSPTGNNELVDCELVRSAAVATTAGAGFTPSGTLTGVTNTLSLYDQYQIQTTATAQNCPYGGASANWTDGQFALLPSSASAGYSGLTGVYGAPAAAQTNGATATIAILNGASGSLSPLAPPTAGTWWSQFSGSATTFDTSIHCAGSFPLLINGVPHILGDSNTSLKIPSANVTTSYAWNQEALLNNGSGEWIASCVQVSSNELTGQGCDTWNGDSTLVEGAITTQLEYDSTNKISYRFEPNSGNTPTSPNLIPSTPQVLSQNYIVVSHYAGVNEPNDEIYVFGENTPGTLPWVQFGHMTWPRSGPVILTTTATQAVAGSNTIVVASATGIVIGQTVWSGTTSTLTSQLTPGTKVTGVSGTTITISPVTAQAMAATPVIFAGNVAEATGSVTAGSTSLTVSGVTGTITGGASGTGQVVGMAGVPNETWVASGSGTSWTLSQPASSTQSSVPVYFWTPQVQGYGFHFGKYSSCNSSGDMNFSWTIFDPYGTVVPLLANGTYSW